MVKVFEGDDAVHSSHGDGEWLVGSESLFYMRSDYFVWMLKPPIDRVDHKADENFASMVGKQPLYQGVWDSRESKGINEGKGWSDAMAVAIKRVENFGEPWCKFSALNIDLEAVGTMELLDLSTKVVSPVLTHFDEEKDKFAAERSAMISCAFQGNDRGSGLAANVTSGAREAVKINNARVRRSHDGEPSFEILAQNLVLCLSMRLDYP